ncbi:ArsR family transcriptional regulator [Natronocella acetinitrilica]|jgi:ArsR family transcriptional regulator, arsenate/arsenite/antimonite-responsive transcriptional repressor|uniref:ArsR family transcriptional regulator n=1 Tax=Natronocella acetinitrilica TaxID=414046 RepID=A0AAE3G7X7_9GAMM|nr:metalloregulator ArsR/SmtB family transcription factor [Natronocella acetinitrilica]MCP1676688.1 ArsR family transcriptional regulator [Natronocella acetinitrilica]
MFVPEQFFKALSDGTRLRCLLLLLAEQRLCVCEFVHALDLSQPRVSRHLGQLRDMGIVQDERRGQWVHYRLHPALPQWTIEVLEAAYHADALADIRQRLAAMPNRPSISCE